MADKVTTAAAAAAGGALVISVVALALVILTKDDPAIPIPVRIKCSGKEDCTKAPLECASTDCVDCHPKFGVCVYGLKAAENCRCVQGELRACDVGGLPGSQVCEKKGTSNTDWGDCQKL